MPRFSVDIDLTYLPLESREKSLSNIERSLLNIKKKIENINGIQVFEKRLVQSKRLSKLFIAKDNIMVKVEPNEVLRSCVFSPINKDLVSSAERLFEMSLTDIPLLSLEDLYAGKICAALGRQHPRDLFDLKYYWKKVIFQDNFVKLLWFIWQAHQNQ